MKKNYFLMTLVLVMLAFSVNAQLTAPFMETFSASTFPTTWNQSATGGGPWVNHRTGSGPAYVSSTIVDHTDGAGGEFTWVDFSLGVNAVIITSDTIDVSAVTIPELNFWFNNNLGSNPCSPYNQLYPEVYNGTTWITLDTLQQENAGVWSEHFYALGAYVLPGNKLVVRFRAEAGASTSGSAYYHDLVIDDISVRQYSLCRVPVSLTADSITDASAITRWSAGPSTDTAWTVQWGLNGFVLGSAAGTLTTVQVDSLLLSGLADLTAYDFYVRGYCTSGDTSAWAGPFTFTTLPSCVAPINQSVSNITAYVATLHWDSGAGPNLDTAWSIKYDTMGFAPATSGTYAHVNVDSLNVTSLSPNTRYDFYVRGYCNSGDTSIWIGPLTFKTFCITDTIPYLQSFSFWPPDCWDMTGGANNWNFNAASGGVAEANFWGTPSGDFHMTTHPIHLTAFARLSFDWSHLYSSSYPLDSLEVQVKVDTSSTWVPIWGLKGTALESNDGAGNTTPGSFKNEVINLDSSYIGKNVMVRFIAVSNYGPDCFIDNVILEEVPSCPRPTLLSHYALFADSVALNWMNGAADSIWEIQYGAPSFPLGTGTTVSDNNDSISFGGLTPSTTYWAYVRSICTVGDTSIWEGPYAFTTPCSFYTPAYTEGFSTYTGSVNPTCWEEAKGILTVNSTLTVGNSNWTSDGFANVGTTGAAKMNIYTTNRYEWLISPSIDLGAGITPYQVEFNVAITDFANATVPDAAGLMGPDDKLVLVISPDNGVTWSDTNILAQWDTANMPSFTGDYFYYNLTAAGYTGQVKFGLYAESSVSNEDNDAFIDNFAVVQVPTCPRPLNLTFDSASLTTANISWTSGAADSSWIMEYGAPGFTRGSGTTVNSSTNPGVITGLTSSTCYDVYLRSICTVGDSSLWIGPMRFCTDCGPVVDLCEDFEAYSAGSLPICWEKFIITTGSSTVQINNFGGSAAPKAVQMNSGNDAGATMFLISPEMTALSAGTHRASFWVDGSFNTDTVLIIGTMSDPANPATFNPWDTIKTITSAYQRFRIPFDTYTGTDTRIAFQYVAASRFRSLTIDDFCFELIPSCEKAPFPTVLNDGVDSTVLNLGWNVDVTQTSFIINYGPAGYDPVTNTAGEVTGTAAFNFFGATGLNALTEYCFWIKAVCTNGDTSAWAGPYCGKTGCPSGVSLPYFEDFSSYRNVFPLDVTPQCWEEAIGTLTTSGGVAKAESQWEADGFANVGFNGAARINFSAFGSRQGWLLTPRFYLGTDVNTKRYIEFDIALTDDFSTNAAPNGFGSDDTVAFVISYDGGTTWKNTDILLQWDTSNEPGVTATHIEYSLNNAVGNVQFGFYGTSQVNNEGVDFFVDNFSIRDTVYAGVDEIDGVTSFKVFPNPNNGQFTVLNEGNPIKSSLKVVDIQGRIVYEEAYYFSQKARKQVDLTKLNSGVYILILQSEGKLEQHRIILNK